MKPSRSIAVLAAVFAALAWPAGVIGDESNAVPAGVGPLSVARIPQPSLDKLDRVTRRRLAHESNRVDLNIPTFTNPTSITNPLFPIGDLRSALLVGKFEGKPWRAETTLLPETRTVEWDGKKIETLQSQFVAYLSGRIYEVAIDLYAQADDGSVWYFGEDAFSYEQGRVTDVSETWHAGVEGPAAMIMPGQPRVGDVYRPENIPGLIFEEVTVKKIGETREGPIGPIQGVMVAQELHMEGDFEDKTFAPGYGELRSGLGKDYEANALAIPVDALSEPIPAELEQLSMGALRILDAAQSKDWKSASAAIDGLRVANEAYQKRRPPRRLNTEMVDALDELVRSAKTHDVHAASLSAIDVARIAADMTLRYRAVAEVDFARFDLWARELIVDALAKDAAAVAGDVSTLGWLRERIVLDGADAERIDDQLRYLVAAADAKDMTSAANAAKRLRQTVAAFANK